MMCQRSQPMIDDIEYAENLFRQNRHHRRPSKEDYDHYAVGLDLGPTSAGWVALAPDYRLLRIKGHDAIGVRLFDEASTAAKRRTFRTMRRRLSRRKWRLHFVDEMFAPELAKIDPNFLMRRRYTWVHKKDEQNSDHYTGGLIFPTLEEDKKFHSDYPTIYHLRLALMGQGAHPIKGKADIRDIYMAVHHIVKYRGNFLREGRIDPSRLCDPRDLRQLLIDCLTIAITAAGDSDKFVADELGRLISVDTCRQMITILSSTQVSASDRRDQCMALIDVTQIASIATVRKRTASALKAVLTALTGNKARLDSIFLSPNASKEDKDDFSLRFSDEDTDQKISDLIDSGLLDDTAISALAQLQDTYQSIVLRQLIGDSHSLSQAMTVRYDQHHDNLKKLLACCASREEKRVLRDDYELLTRNSNRLLGITTKKKNALIKGATEYFKQFIDNHFEDGKEKDSLSGALENGELFPLLRTTMNGSIPYQLHLNELHSIIEHQKKYYPFLADTAGDGKSDSHLSKLESLLTFKIPYYMGPLVPSTDARNSSDNMENHWVTRRPNEESTRITPWNYKHVLDTDAAATEFINRLTGTDTYLIDEPTLPSHSLTYQKYEVLSEINNLRIDYGNLSGQSISFRGKQALLEQLKKQQTLKKSKAEKILTTMIGQSVTIHGLAKEDQFTSSLSSYISLSKVLGRKFVDDEHSHDLLEKIIEIQTVFEDKDMRRRQIAEAFETADRKLDKRILDQLDRHVTGWGRLSRKLLESNSCTIRLEYCGDTVPMRHSILDILYFTDKNLMQILHDKKLGISAWIEDQNADKLETADSPSARAMQVLDDAHISPITRRGVIQAFRILEDLRKATGKEPRRIFIEMADDPQESKQTSSRNDRLKDIYRKTTRNEKTAAAVKHQVKELMRELETVPDNRLNTNDKLFLYFLQQGKDIYTAEPISIDNLEAYDIDHIVPQSLTKDDSLDNRVLTLKSNNTRKSDSLRYTVTPAAKQLWSELSSEHLMSDRKLMLLRRLAGEHGAPGSKSLKRHFTARALVSTRQILTNVKRVIQAAYPHTEIIGASSELTIDMRCYLGYSHKNRDINDLHHAQDALAMASAAQFACNRGFFRNGDITVQNWHHGQRVPAMDAFNLYREKLKEQKRLDATQSGRRIRMFEYVVGSIASSDNALRTNSDGVPVWSDADTQYLRKVMGYRSMLVTRRYDDIDGALWNSTIYPAYSGHANKPRNPLGLNKNMGGRPDLYGYRVSPPTTGIRLLVTTTKGKHKFVLENVSTSTHDNTHDESSQHSRKILACLRPGQPLIIRRQVSGRVVTQRIRIASATEYNNAQEFWLDKTDYDFLDIVMNTVSESAAISQAAKEHLIPDSRRPGETDQRHFEVRLADLFDRLCEMAVNNYPVYTADPELFHKAQVNFRELPYSTIQHSDKNGKDSGTKKKVFDSQLVVLKDLVAALTAGKGRSQQNGSDKCFFGTDFGRIRKIDLSPDDLLVFESPTGLFSSHCALNELLQCTKAASSQTR